MQVALPVQPKFKTMSERATLEYVRHATKIPVPEVFASSASNDNSLGFEWMITARMPGCKLESRWQAMSLQQKEFVTRQFMSYFKQLFEKRNHLPSLGNLYVTSDLQTLPRSEIPETSLLGCESSAGSLGFSMSKIVSKPFFWDKRIDYDVPRGPFKRSHDWLATQLQLLMNDTFQPREIVDGEDSDEDEEETPEEVRHRIQRVIDLLPKIFPDGEAEEFVMHHSGFITNNILVDDDDKVTGVLDWECAHTVPLWMACQTPDFLDADLDRDEAPDPNRFPIEEQWDGKVDRDDKYYEQQDDFEKTHLWRLFLAEMRTACPEWIEVYEANELKRGFQQVVSRMGTSLSDRDVDLWLNRVEKTGSAPTVTDMQREMQKKLNMGDMSAWIPHFKYAAMIDALDLSA